MDTYHKYIVIGPENEPRAIVFDGNLIHRHMIPRNHGGILGAGQFSVHVKEGKLAVKVFGFSDSLKTPARPEDAAIILKMLDPFGDTT